MQQQGKPCRLGDEPSTNAIRWIPPVVTDIIRNAISWLFIKGPVNSTGLFLQQQGKHSSSSPWNV
jgi:hypothetical protein